jgi:hypothetical protein
VPTSEAEGRSVLTSEAKPKRADEARSAVLRSCPKGGVPTQLEGHWKSEDVEEWAYGGQEDVENVDRG